MSGPTIYNSKGDEQFTEEHPAHVQGEMSNQELEDLVTTLIDRVDTHLNKQEEIINKLDELKPLLDRQEIIDKIDEVVPVVSVSENILTSNTENQENMITLLSEIRDSLSEELPPDEDGTGDEDDGAE